jgi:hypothetical protein
MSRNYVCSRCGADLGWAEPDPCGSCTPVRRWGVRVAERLYQVVCRADLRPLKIPDIHRIARTDSESGICHYDYALGTAKIMAPRDARLCWAGQGLYGLVRDGLIPGPRNLADVAVLVICSAEQPMDDTRLEFVMKRMGYRFVVESLLNALRRNDWFDEVSWRRWEVRRGPRTAHNYRRAINPSWPAARFEHDLGVLGERVRTLLDERRRLQLTPPDLSYLDDGWRPGGR